jgi:hypothetical protein
MNSSLIAMVDSTSGRSSQVQLDYRWSQIRNSQRLYLTCTYGDDACCDEGLGGVTCFDAPSTASAFGNLMILTTIYCVLAWYSAQVFGASLGMNRKPWFFLTPEFWGMESEDDRKLAELRAMQEGTGTQQRNSSLAQQFLSQDRLVTEQFLSLKNNELRTYKLSKSYENTSALKECTLKMHAGEVFCLLGHNGAGQQGVESEEHEPPLAGAVVGLTCL